MTDPSNIDRRRGEQSPSDEELDLDRWVAEAVALEREACARTVEFASLDWRKGDPRARFAAAIRARRWP